MNKTGRLSLILVFILSAFSETQSQTLQQTLRWIKTAIETNTYSYINFSTDSTEMVVEKEPTASQMFGIRQKISLKMIQSAHFITDDDMVKLRIKCTSEKCVQIDVKTKDDPRWRFNNTAGFMTILFDNSIDSEMKKRIEKAFNRLIVLQGGTPLDDTF